MLRATTFIRWICIVGISDETLMSTAFYRFFTPAEIFSVSAMVLAATSLAGVTAHGGPAGPLQFDRRGSHPWPRACILTSSFDVFQLHSLP
jgi:hypothetical protein